MRLKGKIAIVVGAGQSPGEGLGNGRATVMRFAQEGATVMAVDRDLASAEETVALASKHGPCVAFEADVTKEKTLAAMVGSARSQFGRIDVLHYNVGLSIAGGDALPTEITEEAFDRVVAINLRGCVMAVKHVLPVMRAQQSGVILTISSLATYEVYPYVTYKATKAAMIAFTQQVAIQNAQYGVRANCILPGLMNTPTIVKPLTAAYGGDLENMLRRRDAQSPTGRMGDGWDIAYAALFLASDEAKYVNGVALPVDGGLSLRFA